MTKGLLAKIDRRLKGEGNEDSENNSCSEEFGCDDHETQSLAQEYGRIRQLQLCILPFMDGNYSVHRWKTSFKKDMALVKERLDELQL